MGEISLKSPLERGGRVADGVCKMIAYEKTKDNSAMKYALKSRRFTRRGRQKWRDAPKKSRCDQTKGQRSLSDVLIGQMCHLVEEVMFFTRIFFKSPLERGARSAGCVK